MEQWIFWNTVIFVNNEVKSRLKIKLSGNFAMFWFVHFDILTLNFWVLFDTLSFSLPVLYASKVHGNIWSKNNNSLVTKDLWRKERPQKVVHVGSIDSFQICCWIIIQMLEYYLSPFEKDWHCFFSSESVQSVSFLLRTSVQESAE